MTASDRFTSLVAFQDAFAQALVAERASDGAPDRIGSLVAQPGFAVYRNTVMKSCVDALQANYPAVVRLVGEAWFRAAAAVFVRDHLPRTPALVDYDARFPDFFATFGPASEIPYLSGVACVDRFWTEAHISADAAFVSARDVARLAPEQLGRCVLRPHPSARWRWFEGMPVHSIWRCNRHDATIDALADLVWRGEGVLIVRPGHAVDSLAVGAADCAFLDACGLGVPLGDAGVAALTTDANADLATMMARLLDAGTFCRIEEGHTS